MTHMGITVGVQTSKGLQHVSTSWQVDKVKWCLLDFRDEGVPPDTIPYTLYDLWFTNEKGTFRYVPHRWFTYCMARSSSTDQDNRRECRVCRKMQHRYNNAKNWTTLK